MIISKTDELMLQLFFAQQESCIAIPELYVVLECVVVAWYVNQGAPTIECKGDTYFKLSTRVTSPREIWIAATSCADSRACFHDSILPPP